jgi:hypothetical protein
LFDLTVNHSPSISTTLTTVINLLRLKVNAFI